jgi:shikimate 5-dehydrogenase
MKALKESIDAYPEALVIQASAAPKNGDDLAWLIPSFKNHHGAFSELIYQGPSALLAHTIKARIKNQDGLPMLIEQARLAQKLWFQKCTPVAVLKEFLA